MIMSPSPEEMEAVRVDAMSQKVVADLKDIPEGTYAIRVSRKGRIIFLTKEEYDKLWPKN